MKRIVNMTLRQTTSVFFIFSKLALQRSNPIVYVLRVIGSTRAEALADRQFGEAFSTQSLMSPQDTISCNLARKQKWTSWYTVTCLHSTRCRAVRFQFSGLFPRRGQRSVTLFRRIAFFFPPDLATSRGSVDAREGLCELEF